MHHALRELPNVIITGDFNAPAKSTSMCTTLHKRLGDVLEKLSQARDPFNQRHFIAGKDGDECRLKPEYCLTALGFAENRLGYWHAWQLLQSSTLEKTPLYSHWSGQLIDHCLFRDCSLESPEERQDRTKTIKSETKRIGVYHTAASDHLPVIIDIEFSSTG